MIIIIIIIIITTTTTTIIIIVIIIKIIKITIILNKNDKNIIIQNSGQESLA
jgi:hypothetical protein